MRKKSKEKIGKYLSNLGFTNRRDTDDFFKSSKILLNKKNARLWHNYRKLTFKNWKNSF